MVYFKDAARAIVQLADAPLSSIKSVNYLLAGANPSAEELAAMMRVDDSRAREEWGWEPHYSPEQMVDDFLREMKEHPQRYK